MRASRVLCISVDDAIRIGELLTEQKDEVGHGNWGAWLKTNVKFSTATARNYMRLYKYRDKVKTLMVSKLASTLKELQGILSEPDPDPDTRKIEYIVPTKQKEEYDKLISYLMEKVFIVPTMWDAALLTARFAFKHKELYDASDFANDADDGPNDLPEHCAAG